jgi:hypothetical protein
MIKLAHIYMLNILMQQARFLDRNKLYILSAGTRKRHDNREHIKQCANIHSILNVSISMNNRASYKKY